MIRREIAGLKIENQAYVDQVQALKVKISEMGAQLEKIGDYEVLERELSEKQALVERQQRQIDVLRAEASKAAQTPKGATSRNSSRSSRRGGTRREFTPDSNGKLRPFTTTHFNTSPLNKSLGSTISNRTPVKRRSPSIDALKQKIELIMQDRDYYKGLAEKDDEINVQYHRLKQEKQFLENRYKVLQQKLDDIVQICKKLSEGNLKNAVIENLQQKINGLLKISKYNKQPQDISIIEHRQYAMEKTINMLEDTNAQLEKQLAKEQEKTDQLFQAFDKVQLIEKAYNKLKIHNEKLQAKLDEYYVNEGQCSSCLAKQQEIQNMGQKLLQEQDENKKARKQLLIQIKSLRNDVVNENRQRLQMKSDVQSIRALNDTIQRQQEQLAQYKKEIKQKKEIIINRMQQQNRTNEELQMLKQQIIQQSGGTQVIEVLQQQSSDQMIFQQTKQLEGKNQQLRQLRKQNNQLTKTISEIQNSEKESQDKLLQVQKQNLIIENQVKTYKKVIMDFEGIMYKRINGLSDIFQKRVSGIINKIEDKSQLDKLSKIVQHSNNLKDENQRLKQQIQEIESNYMNVAQTLNEQSSDKESLQNRYLQLVSQLNSTNSIIQQTHSLVNEQVHLQNTQFLNLTEQVNQQLTRLTQKLSKIPLSQFRQKIDFFKRAQQDLQQSIINQNQQAAENLNKLKRDLDNTKQANKDARKSIMMQSSEKDSHNIAFIQRLNEELQGKSQKLQEKNKQIQDLEHQVELLQQQLKDEQQNADSQVKSHKLQIQSLAQQLKEAQDKSENELNQANKNYQDLQLKLQSKHKEFIQAQQKLNEIEVEYNSYQTQLKNMSNKEGSVKQLLSQSQHQYAQLQARYTALEQTSCDLEDRISTISSKKRMLKDQLALLKKNVMESDEQLQKLQAQNLQLSSQLRRASEDNIKAEKNEKELLNTVEQSKGDYDKMYNTYKQDQQKNEQRIQQLQQENSALITKNNEIESENKSLIDQIDQIQQQNNFLQSQNSELLQVNQDLLSKNKELQSQNDQISGQTNEFSDSLIQTKTILQNYQQTVDNKLQNIANKLPELNLDNLQNKFNLVIQKFLQVKQENSQLYDKINTLENSKNNIDGTYQSQIDDLLAQIDELQEEKLALKRKHNQTHFRFEEPQSNDTSFESAKDSIQGFAKHLENSFLRHLSQIQARLQTVPTQRLQIQISNLKSFIKKQLNSKNSTIEQLQFQLSHPIPTLHNPDMDESLEYEVQFVSGQNPSATPQDQALLISKIQELKQINKHYKQQLSILNEEIGLMNRKMRRGDTMSKSQDDQSKTAIMQLLRVIPKQGKEVEDLIGVVSSMMNLAPDEKQQISEARVPDKKGMGRWFRRSRS